MQIQLAWLIRQTDYLQGATWSRNQHVVFQSRTFFKHDFTSISWYWFASNNSLYVFTRYAGGWCSSTHSGRGLTIVSNDGPINSGKLILLTLLFSTTRWKTLLYFPLVRICHKFITYIIWDIGINNIYMYV